MLPTSAFTSSRVSGDWGGVPWQTPRERRVGAICWASAAEIDTGPPSGIGWLVVDEVDAEAEAEEEAELVGVGKGCGLGGAPCDGESQETTATGANAMAMTKTGRPRERMVI